MAPLDIRGQDWENERGEEEEEEERKEKRGQEVEEEFEKKNEGKGTKVEMDGCWGSIFLVVIMFFKTLIPGVTLYFQFSRFSVTI